MEPHKRTGEPSPSSPAGEQAAAETSAAQPQEQVSRYELQKRRDWNSFLRYIQDQRPPLYGAELCSGAHVIDFLRYLDQFGKTKVHAQGCVFYGHPSPTGPCPCPFRQAWGSLDALTGRLRAAYEESGGAPEANPFATSAVRAYLREVRESQARARGISYKNKKRRRPQEGGGASPPHGPRERTCSCWRRVFLRWVARLGIERPRSVDFMIPCVQNSPPDRVCYKESYVRK